MIYFLYFIIIFVATFLGALAGLGGGVIIKPALDFIGAHDLATIGILSSFAVFTMSIYSTVKQIKNKVTFDFKLILLISFGAILGGTIGNTIFDSLLKITDDKLLNLVQIVLLVILLIFVLLNVNTNRKNLAIKNNFLIFIIGIVLGTTSSFLSIGGGPINVAVFVLLFSFDIKTSAIYSIATILFAQASKLFTIAINGKLVGFDFSLLLPVIPAAILGGIIGTMINKKVNEKTVKTIFNNAVICIILLNLYNGIMLLLEMI